ncbi:MAG: hypothetical protein ACJ741_10150 [Pyrinomonadaceae bacterium]
MHAQTAILPPVGGSGGSQFVARCAGSELLTGFELRAGDDVDAIRPLCVAAFGPHETSPVQLTNGSGLIVTGKNAVGADIVKLEGGWYGGTGGGLNNVICPKDTPIVTGMYVRAEGVHTITVNNIHLFCGVAASTQQPSEFPSAVFDAPLAESSVGLFTQDVVRETQATQYCPAGLVAVGINGRSGVWLDATGLICGEPKLTPKPVVLGRVQSTTPEGPPMSICQRARDARARNSPAAPSLEAQCRAASKKPAVVLGRVQETQTDAAPRPICEVARDARARNSPAAPGLEAQCRTYLAAKGATIAEADAELAEARGVEPDALYRQGFDIATGIFGDPAQGAQGNTALGPGSQRIRASLSAVGQRGFDASVKIHLSRKYQ